ncbi:MAG: hypothetical protein N3F63_04330 [Thermoplasmata archaeon]|nr:hypothetical protein [Thermoplasmata archaeon]
MKGIVCWLIALLFMLSPSGFAQHGDGKPLPVVSGVHNPVILWPTNESLEKYATIYAEPDVINHPYIEPEQNVTITIEARPPYKIESSNEQYQPSAMVNVTNVLWDGTEWYSESDGTVWHRNSSGHAAPYYYRENEYKVKVVIWARNGDGGEYNFQPGSKITWWVAVSNCTYDAQTGTWITHYLESSRYTFEIGGAWPYKPPLQDLFDRNLIAYFAPASPNIGDPVDVYVETKPDVNVKLQGASIEGRVVYPDSTTEDFYLGFSPGEGEWPSKNATARISGYYHSKPEIRCMFRIVAWDPFYHKIYSDTYEYTVSKNGTWKYPSNFAQNIRVKSKPENVTANTTKTPQVDIGIDVNITIESLFSDVPIKVAYIYYTISNTWHNVPLKAKNQMIRIKSTEFYYIIPGQPQGVNVTFYIRAWDVNNTPITSKNYTYSVKTLPPAVSKTRAIFYVGVVDIKEQVERPLPFVNITILNDSWQCHTQTDYTGYTYPNMTGNKYAPYYLTVGEKYVIIIYLDSNNNTTIYFSYNLTREQDDNETLYESVINFTGKPTRVRVFREGNTITCYLNAPKAPPVYAEVSEPDYIVMVGEVIGITIFLVPLIYYFVQRRKKAEEEEKRITV